VSYSGPKIVTIRPEKMPSEWTTLPNLTTTKNFGDGVSYPHDMRYCASAVSPYGDYLFLLDSYLRIFNLATGTEVRSVAYTDYHQRISHAIWYDNSIYAFGKKVVTIQSGDLNYIFLDGQISWRNSDTTFIFTKSTGWSEYNMKTKNFYTVPRDFTPYNNNPMITTVSKRPIPSSLQYVVGRYPDYTTDWAVYNSSLTFVKSLSPIKSEMQNALTSRIAQQADGAAIWLSNDMALIETFWTGKSAYWVVNLATNQYYQLTGYASDQEPSYSPTSVYSYKIGVNPCLDFNRERVLFFYPLNETAIAVRGIPIPE
jgi:hypothetical protein